ncbi:MAG: flagellar biosynthetic protein FliO [Pseudomonadota bacterium]|nr:flagellar biosynthetic protein FliO [Pseudomonadota bacterium]
MDILDFSRIFFALIAVLGMIGLCAMIARKAGLAQNALQFAKRRRLAAVESLALDARRRAVILRCDGREHLVILGPTSETVVEKDIPPAPPLEIVEPAPQPSFADAMARLKTFAGANPFSKAQKADAA